MLDQPLPTFPFSAIVGQDQLRLALILCALEPSIGGVLIRGEKGTAKSTAVRALVSLLPPVQVMDDRGQLTYRPARLVELPVGATEDRVVGSLDLEKVLSNGERAFQPGLLAAAHQGVLYVDEVNLLHDHLVDVLLDAAAMGRVHIERDGISHSHEAHFVLVGTMNPEEGELRPQLLDRFGLAVDVVASREVDTRMEVVRRRLEYEQDRHAFIGKYRQQDIHIAQKILTARELLANVELSEDELRRISSVCAALEIDGMRGDLVVARTAKAHAAWCGNSSVSEADVRIAVELALPHRRRRNPFDEPGLDSHQLDEAFNDAQESMESRDSSSTQSELSDVSNSDEEPDPEPDGGLSDPQREENSGSQAAGNSDQNLVVKPAQSAKPRIFTVPGTGTGDSGRRSA
ncbi:MAG: ATP-binding protein, partial [Mycobacteriaceae bacterium]